MISWWTAVRAARADRPVEWSFASEPHGDHDAINVRITCRGADALSLVAEGHFQSADRVPGFWIHRQPVVEVGDAFTMLFPPGVVDGGWVVLSWCHPKNRLRPLRAWFPVAPSGTAFDEYRRQTTQNPLLLWLRGRILLSPVRPGGIPGRTTGWRDRWIVRRELRQQGVKRWRPVLPYETRKAHPRL
ncbi:hypothetical protein ACFWN7_13570 [Agromyces sp. NPDC058484]|uniref:hypothetical protein n=1 Tax=Agromyces sp. NPDC058484 TaxID=3346524 RepID=UPI0036553A58